MFKFRPVAVLLAFALAIVAGASFVAIAATASQTLPTDNDMASQSPVDYANASLMPSAVPEPASWSLMVAGFGMVGYARRRRQIAVTA